MITTISNDIKIQDPTKEIIDWCNTWLVLDNPLYKQLKVMGKEDTIRYRHIPEKINLYGKSGTKLILPFGLLRSVWDMIKIGQVVTSFNKTDDISIVKDKPTIEFYDYQNKAIQAMVKAKGGVLVASCGAGKTIMGIELIHSIGKKALWLTHTADLLRQAKEDMLELYPNIKIGVTTDGKLEIGEDVTISTIQTLVNIDSELYKNEFEVIICDESAHVCGSPTQYKMFTKILSIVPARYKFGLTATPTRADGMIKAMYAYLGTSQSGLFEPTYKVDRSEVKTLTAVHNKFELATKYNEFNMWEIYDTSGMIVYNKLIDSLSNNEERNQIILHNIVECSKQGRKQVVLTLRVEHCEYLVEELNKRGVKAVLCVGKTTAKNRTAILNQKVEWEVLVATYALLKEGVSIKELDTLHMVTPVKEKGMVIQCAGRIERYLEGKKQPIVWDYVDTDIPYCEKAFNSRRRALKKRF